MFLAWGACACATVHEILQVSKALIYQGLTHNSEHLLTNSEPHYESENSKNLKIQYS